MNEITKEMIALAAKGDQNAIEELYRLTYNSVYKAARVLIQDEDTVLDVVQDSYVKAFQSLDQLDSPENFRAWLKRIATNKAKDYLKKKKPILFTDMAGEDGEEIDFRDDCLDHCPEEVLDRKETARLIQEILATLSEDQRLVIGMFYYEEMSVREIAQTLDCSENTVKSRLNYGRKKVEAKVKELEKKGTKLYSLAPLPFLLWLLRMDAEVVEIPSGAALQSITAACASGSAASAGTAGAGVKAAVATGAKSTLAAKVAAGALAVTIAGGGIVATLSGTEVQENYTHDELLSSYQEACRDNCKLWRENRKAYKLLDGKTIESFRSSDAMNIVYCDRDLDGNGTEEVLIGLYDPYENWIELDCVYTFDDGYAVTALAREVIPAESEFEDAILEELSLTRDDQVFKYHGNGEGMFYYTLWQLSEDGVTMEQIGEFTEDVLNDRVAFEGQTISCHEFRMNYYETITHTLPWEILVPHPRMPGQPPAQQLPETEPTEASMPETVDFDALLDEIRSALSISAQDYDADMEYYDSQYSHLGEGIMWELMHRQSGDHTMCIWYTNADIDGDGQEELILGRGVSPSDAAPIRIFRHSGEIIFGDAIYSYTGLPPLEWNYLGG